MNIEKTLAGVKLLKTKSAWSNGVKNYAIDFLLDLDGENIADKKDLEKALLNGADNWSSYSYGGCAFMYDEDIARFLCNRSTFKRKKYGALPPNSKENWLDVQARALWQAFRLICTFAVFD